MKRTLVALVVAVAALSTQFATATNGFETTSCKYPAGHPLPGAGAVRHVGTGTGDFATIQDAVNAAVEGDTILIAPGEYKEEVLVKRPGLRIRGESRTGVVLNGESTRNVGIEVEADRVVVENLTVHNYKGHGVHWLFVTGYWGRYITAYDMGDYGIFAFGSRCGEFSDSYGSGNADSAIYIGQCYPCDARIHDVDAEENGLGYSGTNAGGNLVIHDSIWRNNALGVVPSSLDSEARPPSRGLTIENNIIDSNNLANAPGAGLTALFWGVGVALAGTSDGSVTGNTITNNAMAGIVINPLPDTNVYLPYANTIWGNTVSHDADLWPDSYDLAQGAGSGPDNCWSDNTTGVAGQDLVVAPPLLQTVWGCDVIAGTQQTPPGGDPRVEASLIEGFAGLNGRTISPWQTWPALTCADHAIACADQPDDNGAGGYADDGAVDGWLPDLASRLA
ncbi:MAG: right-handed parallel beta-helix repeat-containing protein [Actinomycetota bacterium]